MVEVVQTYSVPVVFHNVSDSESLEEVVKALTHLRDVAKSVFDRIEAQVSTERERIKKLGTRVSQASAQVASISSNRSRKATTFFSQARFPGKAPSRSGMGGLSNYKPIFAGMPHRSHPDIPEPESAPRMFPANDGSSADAPSQAEMLDLLWRANQVIESELTPDIQGIGPLPADLESVASYLLYNSVETPYTEYDETLDNMQSVRQRDAIEEETRRKMAAQGSTLLSGDQLPAVQGLDKTYKPTMKSQPSMQFQTNLDFGANLPAVASDTAWSGGADDEALGSIAPSALTLALPDVPMIADAPPASAGAPASAPAGGPPPSTVPSGPPAAAAPPPPPPPPTTPPANPTPQAPRGARGPRGPPSSAPRGPPPLPQTPSTKARLPPAAANPGRGGLLASIRSGKSLKPSSARKLKPKKAPAKSKGGGMSLMEQMQARLSRRANVMSGREDDEAQSKQPKKHRRTITAKAVVKFAGSASRAKKAVAESKSSKSSSRRSSTVADDIITGRPSMDENDTQVGGFSTKGMAGLQSLLKAKSSKKSVQSNASSEASEDDWDSD